ncbi:MAG: AMP-binding protein [Henriciella sp.]|nr:AMP-binding protein [Henriciella sp.]MBO6694854.1 AMP-binding protein [Henriciella sp.]
MAASPVSNFVPNLNPSSVIEADRLHDKIFEAESAYGDAPFLTTALPNGQSETTDFKTAIQSAQKLARYLREDLGYDQGDVVAIQSPNCTSYIVSLLGVYLAGLTITNVNPLYTAAETRRQLKDSGARCLIGSTIFSEMMEDAVEGTNVDQVISISLTDFFSPMTRSFLNLLLQKVKKLDRPFKGAHTRLVDILSADAPHRVRYVDTLEPTRDTIYQYSGGTTGVSKGVRLTEQGLMSNIAQFAVASPELLNTPQQTMLLALPVYHVFGMLASVIAITNGGHLVLVPNPRPLTNMKPAFKKFKPDYFPGVNTLFEKLLEEDWFLEHGRSLKITISGAAALHDRVARRWMEVTGSNIIEGYGMTEATTLIAVRDHSKSTARGSAGTPLPGTEVRLLSNGALTQAPNIVGEIVISGPQVMTGYLGREQETKASYHGDWFKTGDMGKFDKSGELHIVDRCKDMVLVSGFNVFPNEVDEVLSACPGVGEAASAGIRSEDGGEELHAFIVKGEGELREADVLAYCRDHLTGYKVPRKVHFIEELPKNPIGKILRRKLQECL